MFEIEELGSTGPAIVAAKDELFRVRSTTYEPLNEPVAKTEERVFALVLSRHLCASASVVEFPGAWMSRDVVVEPGDANLFTVPAVAGWNVFAEPTLA